MTPFSSVLHTFLELLAAQPEVEIEVTPALTAVVTVRRDGQQVTVVANRELPPMVAEPQKAGAWRHLFPPRVSEPSKDYGSWLICSDGSDFIKGDDAIEAVAYVLAWLAGAASSESGQDAHLDLRALRQGQEAASLDDVVGDLAARLRYVVVRPSLISSADRQRRIGVSLVNDTVRVRADGTELILLASDSGVIAAALAGFIDGISPDFDD
jgi:hypothetical protein